MHYTIRYDRATTDRNTLDERARDDVFDYVGEKAYLLLLGLKPDHEIETLSDAKAFYKVVLFYCDFAGVQGYPAKAMARHILKYSKQSEQGE